MDAAPAAGDGLVVDEVSDDVGASEEVDGVVDLSPVELVGDADCAVSGLVVELDVCAEITGAAHSAMALKSAMMLIRCLLMMCPL